MNKKNYYTEFCTACGLCSAYKKVKFSDRGGFDIPKIENEEQLDFCQQICPVNSHIFNECQEVTLWGKNEGVFRAYSLNDTVRFKAASGGIITSLGIFLLNTHRVDYVLQIGKEHSSPLKTKLYCNSKMNEVIECAASRYITGISYENLLDYIVAGKKYAIIGKPCDIEAVTNLMRIDPLINQSLKYRLTFFCAGAPGREANKKLISSLGASIKDVLEIRYRGNGWPGLATIITDRSIYTMPYIDSWNKILGRDIRKICKFCINGIGEIADVSCGDLWKLNADKKPIFNEEPGQNIVFARSETGLELLHQAQKEGYIHLEEYVQIDDLGNVQPNHIMKRTTMLGKMLGMKLIHHTTPHYNLKHLKKLSNGTGRLKIIKTALGTVKRGIKGTL